LVGVAFAGDDAAEYGGQRGPVGVVGQLVEAEGGLGGGVLVAVGGGGHRCRECCERLRLVVWFAGWWWGEGDPAGEGVQGAGDDRGVDRVEAGQELVGVAFSGQDAAQHIREGGPVGGVGQVGQQLVDGGGGGRVTAGGG